MSVDSLPIITDLISQFGYVFMPFPDDLFENFSFVIRHFSKVNCDVFIFFYKKCCISYFNVTLLIHN